MKRCESTMFAGVLALLLTGLAVAATTGTTTTGTTATTSTTGTTATTGSTSTAATEGEVNPVGVSMFRQAPGHFTPGQALDIVVTIQGPTPSGVTAMGVFETIPDGWIFQGMRGMSGDPPSITPPNPTGTLEFAWINTPTFPIAFAYTVLPAQDSGGTQYITGQVEYRTMGGRLNTPVRVDAIIGPDNSPPTIELKPPVEMTLTVGEPYSEPGYTATDAVDGDVTSRVQVTGEVNIEAAGDYVLSYTVTDKAGNQSTAVQRIVHVVANAAAGTTTTGGTTTGGATTGGSGTYAGYNPSAASAAAALAKKNAQTGATQTPTVAKNQILPGANGAGATDAKGNPVDALKNAQVNGPHGPGPLANKGANGAKADGQPADASTKPGEAGQTVPTPNSSAATTLLHPEAMTAKEQDGQSGGTKPPKPVLSGQTGKLAALAAQIAQISSKQWMALAAVFGAAIIVLAMLLLVARMAYSPPPRRRPEPRIMPPVMPAPTTPTSE